MQAVLFSRDWEIDGQVTTLRRSPGWRSLHAGWTRALGIEDLRGIVVVVRFDVLGRLPAKFTDWGLCIADSVEDICACEARVAFVLSVSEVDYRRGGVSYQSGMRAGKACQQRQCRGRRELEDHDCRLRARLKGPAMAQIRYAYPKHFLLLYSSQTWRRVGLTFIRPQILKQQDDDARNGMDLG